MRPGAIILLNGTSCAGKTSIGRAIQALADEPYLLMGADVLGAICPPRYAGGDQAADGFTWVHDAGGPGRTALVPGPYGQALIGGWHQAIGALAAAGHNVVVDHILLDAGWLPDCVAAWRELPVLFVGVRCPLAVAEAREAARPSRLRGYARWAFDRVHAHGVYDLEVDTSERDAESCARVILDRLRDGLAFTAFRRLDGTPLHSNWRP